MDLLTPLENAFFTRFFQIQKGLFAKLKGLFPILFHDLYSQSGTWGYRG